ncbi:partitioning defective 3 homolog isoform X2 [Octopus bimaculoides]|uniref:partitioning defective 3 homolog isoform X2 n=1 Tax=Octopus bimaculoides TaxID=37653 RepID=UPI00071E2271|nr:partitioning defective 3 homolog isoform X2 [Octopus bimaculoides]|eukprot:XP_014776117.1 PREDICTED: partitioning defective 3 homolog isoform X2 [Octopus bimaculoides]
MKVTVCFDNVKVIVPCGDGYLPVKELIEKAVIRYKKATGKSNDSWVTVHSLKTLTDEGILDPDDYLNDVVDDREQLIAIYDETERNHVFNNGDGASASSVGTSSPDIFQNNNGPTNSSNGDFKASSQTDNGVVVTLEDVLSGPTLHVRRGSEPALVNLGEVETSSDFATKPEPASKHKRWSTFGNEREFQTSTPKEENGDSQTNQEKCLQPRWNSTGHNKNKHFASHFSREYSRQSLGARPSMLKWFEAQERYEEKLKDAQTGSKDTVAITEKYKNNNVAEKELEIIVTLKNDGEPLGIHVLPDYDEDEKETGLLVQSIEPGSKISCDGRLKPDDRIVEINGVNLMGISFDNAQNIFRDAMRTDEIQLKVLKSIPPPLPKKPPPLLPKPTVRNQKPLPKSKPQKFPSSEDFDEQTETAINENSQQTDEKLSENQYSMPPSHDTSQCAFDKENDIYFKSASSGEEESNPSSPNKKVPPAVPARHPTTALSTKDKSAFSASTNTRKIGKKLLIQLKKGSNGLGFSITTRDNQTGGEIPIYIKSILLQGAAIEDGRLKTGDRLLEVDGVEMTGKSQIEAVTILRNTKMGHDVELLVSRQELDKPPVKPPRENVEKTASHSVSPVVMIDNKETSPIPSNQNHEFIVLDIQLNETSSAGLGVSVKGNTNPSESGTNRDLGIFIKAIISGGAASKDGRLKVNDQLLEINGHSLLRLTNQDAMETLRETMRSIDPVNGKISLVIARVVRDVVSPLSLNSSVEDSANKQKDSFSDELESIEHGNLDHNAINQQNNHTKNSVQPRKCKGVKISNVDVNSSDSTNMEISKPLPPQVERLRSGYTQEGINNDSYNQAVHSSFNDSISSYFDHQGISPTSESKNNNSSSESKHSVAKTYSDQGLQSVTVNPPEQEAILIEDELFEHDDRYPPVFVGDPSLSYHSKHRHKDFDDQQEQNSPTRIPHQNISRLPQPHRKSSDNQPPPYPTSHPSEVYHSNQYRNPSDRSDNWHPHITDKFDGVEFDSLSPDLNPNFAFQREAFGRQSMSEKRRGHLDARQTEFYQIAKSNRKVPGGKQGVLVRAGSMESLIGNKSNLSNTLHDNMSPRVSHPNMGLRKRSSSMESLPTPDNVFENAAPPFWAVERVNRAHMCNESFRAAVDRSYEVPHLSQNMETLEEENSDSGSVVGQNYAPHPIYTSISNTDAPNIKENSQPKVNKKKERDNRKSGGFLKGIFKFNKSNKEDKGSKDSNENASKQKNEKPPSEILEMDKNWKNPRGDQNKFSEYQRSPQSQVKSQPHKPRAVYPKEHHAMDIYPYNGMGNNRSDKIQQLREDHQRKHQERQGRYPHDDTEDLYEKHLQDLERRKLSNYSSNPNQLPYQEVEYAIVNKNRPPGVRTVQHERVPVHPSHPPYNYVPESNNDERFYDSNYSEIVPKFPPPYPRTVQESWQDEGYDVSHSWQPSKHKDDIHGPSSSIYTDNIQGSQKHWIHTRSGVQSAPPTWQHKIPVETPVPMEDHYNYCMDYVDSFQDQMYASVPSGKRTPTQIANV